MQRTAWLLAFGLGTLASAGIWAVTTLNDRRAVLAAAEVNLAATARLLEEHADRALDSGDRAVRAAVQAAGDPRSLRAEGRGPATHARLQAAVAGRPQLAAIWVLDANGNLVAENLVEPPPTPAAFAGSEYFERHRQGERDLHIGPLAIGARTQRPRFTLSRAVLSPDGDFAGVAAAGVYSGYFAAVYADLGLGPDAQFGLYRSDGAPLVVWPMAEGGPVAADPGHLAAWSTTGGELPGEELRAVRQLARYPVVLVVTRPLEGVLAAWRVRTVQGGVLAVGLVVTLGILTLFGLRGARQQRVLTSALQTEREALERRVAQRTAALSESEARFREMADNAPVMVWVTNQAGNCTYLSRSWSTFTGLAPERGLGDGWLAPVHPGDRDRTASEFAAAVAAQRGFQIEYRLRRADGAWRWTLDAAAPRRGTDGRFLGFVGSVLDITDRREAQERQTLMARELDHRAKNALAVVQAALRLTPRTDAAAYAQAVEGRVAALARAHSVLAQGRWQGVPLRDVAEAELTAALSARAMPAAARPTLLDGPEVLLGATSVQALSMALHELATNAVRHGALCGAPGRVELGWTVDSEAGLLRLRWVERDGPPVAGTPSTRGFGMRMIESTAVQLGGRVEWRWEASGLTCLLDLPLRRVLAGPEAATAPWEAAATPIAAD